MERWNRVPICVCDGHGDVLFFWKNTHEGRARSVLHLDSHADMMTNWTSQLWTDAGPGWEPPAREPFEERIATEVDLANFQPSAVFQGLVDAIVWLRSDFTLGRYNGPPPGHYRRVLGMPNYAVPGRDHDPVVGEGARPLLAFFHVSGKSFAEYGSGQAFQRRPEVPLEHNTRWDDGWNCTRPPVEALSASFNHSVVTLEQLGCECVLREVRETLRVDGHSRDWILDIDLDFFATYSPLLAFLIRKHHWTARSAAEAFAAWAVPLGQLAQDLERTTSTTLFSHGRQLSTVRVIVQLPFSEQGCNVSPPSEDILLAFREIHHGCDIAEEVLSGFSDLVSSLTPLQRIQWTTLEDEDWWWVMQPQAPHHHSTPYEISAAVCRLEPILASFASPPSLVTIARSLDMYMPEGAADQAEWEVLLLLRRLWPQGAHPLPSSLQECRQEHVDQLMQNVTLYATTRPLPGQAPQPMKPRPWPFPKALARRESGSMSSQRVEESRTGSIVFEVVD